MTQKKFINPETVLFHAGLKNNQVLADFGAGSGHYAVAAGKIVGSQGAVHVVDIKDSALDHTAAEARMHNLRTVKTYLADLESGSSPARLPKAGCDMVLLSNIMHEVSNHKNVLAHAYALLKSGGRLLAVDWNEKPSPIGPPAEKRISEPSIKKIIESAGFKFDKKLEADDFHYALVFEK